MADSCENINLSFICSNISCHYEVGKLKLSYPFIEEYGNVLPERIYLELPCGKVWKGYFRRGSDVIEGLEEMMKCYGIKPYHMLIFHYSGGPNFKIQIFNECAVEIPYPEESFDMHTAVRTRRNSGLFENIGLDCTDVEVQKMRETLYYNANVNFLVLHEIEITNSDLKSQYQYQVLSEEACKKMQLDVDMDSIRIGFNDYMWTIKLKWKKGSIFFDNNWYQFLTTANVVVGDVCVFHRTKVARNYRIAVLSKKLKDLYGISEEYFKAIPTDVNHGWKWFKIVNNKSLETGELEVPRLFSLKFGHEIDENITIEMSNGQQFLAKFNSSRNCISGLRNIIKKYYIYNRNAIFFEYNGQSNFLVSVYDYHGLDLLKEVTGEYIEFENLETEFGTEVIIISDTSEDEYSGSVLGTETESMDEESEMSEDDDENIVLVENLNEMIQEESFTVVLRKSHVNQSSHGAYCSPELIHIYNNWSNGTETTFNYHGGNWNVAVLRKGRSCRFGRGWDSFIKDNQLHEGTKLRFQFQHPLRFEVSISI